MARKSTIEKNKSRDKLVQRLTEKRKALKSEVKRTNSAETCFTAVQKLSKLPRNSAKTRLRNRCVLTGRPRGYYRKLGLSRIALRQLASEGMIPGMVKSSW